MAQIVRLGWFGFTIKAESGLREAPRGSVCGGGAVVWVTTGKGMCFLFVCIGSITSECCILKSKKVRNSQVLARVHNNHRRPCGSPNTLHKHFRREKRPKTYGTTSGRPRGAARNANVRPRSQRLTQSIPANGYRMRATRAIVRQ